MIAPAKGKAMERRRIGLAFALGVLLLSGLAMRPHANFELQMQDAADRAPHRMQAAVDLGVMAISVLITWTSRHVDY
jgi:hypothetical protein